jgi:NitT/TauT family transport system substrate-binding protein
MNRREFLNGTTLAAGAGLLGVRPLTVAAAEPPLETTRIRISRTESTCVAPELVAEDLLRGEGFSEVQYVMRPTGTGFSLLAAGEVDLHMPAAGQVVRRIDAGDPIVVLAGVHVGCYELFGSERIKAVRDLKGKTVAVPTLVSGHYAILATMLAHVGIDPRRDLTVVEIPIGEAGERLAAGKIDGLVAFPPEPQELRAKRIGHVVVNTILDRPWWCPA